MLELAITVFVTLFVIIDPIGLTPMYIALVRGMEPAQKRAVALRACVIAIGILAAFGIFGENLLGFIGISMPAFRISGGILLFLTAIEMLFERRTERRENVIEEKPDPSVFPLAVPLLAGPGAMTSMILLVGNHPGDYAAQGVIFGVMVVVVATAWVLFLLGPAIERLLGHTGVNVVTRLLGMLLAALSVQFVLDGLRDFGLMGG